MPKGTPAAADVTDGKITFFALDTSLIQAAGYNFNQGALHLLPKQIPSSMVLQIPEIVVSEVVKHRMEPVEQAFDKFKGSAKDLGRHTALNFRALQEQADAMSPLETAAAQFRDEVHAYAESCRGGVLEIAGADAGAAAAMFQNYFAGKPPFGKSRENKAEFPDAMSLWLLEQYAEQNGTMGIVASADDGWADYAAASTRLYHLRSIDELTALFRATTGHADRVRAALKRELADTSSPLRFAVTNRLESHFNEASWDASELYSGSGRIDAEVTSAQLADYELEDDPDVWPVEGVPANWIIELRVIARAKVSVSVEFFIWDSVDREEMSFGHEEIAAQEGDISVDVYLTCSDVHLDTPSTTWGFNVEIADGSYQLEGFEVEFDYGPPDYD